MEQNIFRPNTEINSNVSNGFPKFLRRVLYCDTRNSKDHEFQFIRIILINL